jgi:putative ABC transport system permease protein
MLRALDRKLLREMRLLKGQVATIALVLAGGIASFIGMRGTYTSLERSRDAYYDRQRFADVFAVLEHAPLSLVGRLEAVPGVAALETRISKEVMLPIEGMARAASGRLVSLPDRGEPRTNAIYLRAGRMPEPERDDEVVVLESFAKAHALSPGHRIPAVIAGKLHQLRVVGIALSPEFVYAIRPGALAHDPRRYAVLWMNRASLAAAFQLEGAFNDLSVQLQPNASSAAVRLAIDRILEPYGGNGAIDRADQPSNKILTGELDQLAMVAGMVPVVFLGVGAFLVNLVLGRLISLQRTEIAALKAVGYTNRELGRHYLGLVGVVVVPGAILGTLAGVLLGRAVVGLYAGIFGFPDLRFFASPALLATALLVSAAAAIAGALMAVRAAVKLPPAEAMRPPAPARYRRSRLERWGIGALAGPNGMMVLREIWRRPLRTLLSSLGIAGAIALVILGRFGVDSLESYFEVAVRREQRHDLAVAFVRPVTTRVVREFGAMPGVLRVEAERVVPVSFRTGHRTRETAVIGLGEPSTLRRLIERSGVEVELPANGLVVSKTLGRVLGLRIGDRPEMRIREGGRPVVRPVIVGFVDDTVGLQAYARHELLAALEGDAGAVSSVLLRVDPLERPRIEATLRRSPSVIDVSDLTADMDRLRDMNTSVMNVWTVVSISLAAAVIFGVVYNNARINLAARSRDLASLRVLGFTRRQISGILIGTLTVEVVLAIPLGLYLGALWSKSFMASVDQEVFRFAVFVAPRTYLLATGVALGAAAISALWVRRSLDRLDLIGVLKTRE